MLDTAEDLLLCTTEALSDHGTAAYSYIQDMYAAYDYKISYEWMNQAILSVLYYGEGDCSWSDAMSFFYSGIRGHGKFYEECYAKLRSDSLFEILNDPDLGKVKYSDV